MPKLTEFTDLGGEPVYDGPVLGALMRAERRRRGMTTSEIVAQLLRSRHRIAISSRQYDKLERGEGDMPLSVFIAFVEIVRPRGGTAFAAEGLSESACEVLGLKKFE